MELSNKTMIAVVVGKMIVMPVIGMISTWFLEHNYNPFPDGAYRTSVHAYLTCHLCITRTGSFGLNLLLIFNTTLLSLSHFKEIDATCYLVMMIVFITPTANNVMIMVELSGSSSKVIRSHLFISLDINDATTTDPLALAT